MTPFRSPKARREAMSLCTDIAALRLKALRLGLSRTAQALEAPVFEVGFEVAGKAQATDQQAPAHA